MINRELLLDTIKGSGLRPGYIADRLSISNARYYSLVKQDKSWRTDMVKNFCDVVGIDKDLRDKIFFGDDDE